MEENEEIGMEEFEDIEMEEDDDIEMEEYEKPPFIIKVDGIYYELFIEACAYVESVENDWKRNLSLGHIVIPSEVLYEGVHYKVTKIGEYAFSNCLGLTSVEIPDSVTEIGRNAFEGCTGLTSVKIPASVTEIGFEAFSGCTALTSVVIPESVTKIGWDAFEGCTGLKNFQVDADNPTYCDIEGVLFSKDKTKILAYPNAKATEYKLPDSVMKIGYKAFDGCTGLISVEIPASVTEIGEATFFNCTGLTSVKIPESVVKIDSNAFLGCTGLKEFQVDSNNGIYCTIEGALFSKDKKQLISYPNAKSNEYKILDSVTKIGKDAFARCTGLTSVVIPTSVTEIGEFTFFNCTGLTSVTIPNSVTEIGEGAFRNCTGLTSVVIPNSVKEIDGSAFSECTSLKSIQVDANNPAYCDIEGILFSKDKKKIVAYPNAKADKYKIPSRVTEIGDLAFRGCTGLKSVEIPASVTEIGWEAFSGCTGLTSVEIPASVTKIGEWAFYGCDNLKEFTCKAVVPPRAELFSFSTYEKLYVPKASLEAYREHNIWGTFDEILPIEE